ncbi:hypothetical protein Pmani_024762 [Petrolisthes manimaculis]|uniref:Uncharacterized protein n=1 Tax=Petrolisthes manimaculis TaxID=1843537 RepID=A0AAE1U1U2_9EUCA|nr:hypothetical protein Pmani_024762 [Petrolisthes manimaculis]
MAKSLSELRRLQRTQLARINKEELIESILAAPDQNEGLLKDMAEKFRDLVREVADLRQAVTSPDGTINKKRIFATSGSDMLRGVARKAHDPPTNPNITTITTSKPHNKTVRRVSRSDGT